MPNEQGQLFGIITRLTLMILRANQVEARIECLTELK